MAQRAAPSYLPISPSSRRGRAPTVAVLVASYEESFADSLLRTAIAAIPYGEGSPLISAIYGGGQLSIFLGWVRYLQPLV